ncbi:cytochrome P450 [Lactarius hatsudake]|nr:cytochrome P450 [Lactarius hatsudake]
MPRGKQGSSTWSTQVNIRGIGCLVAILGGVSLPGAQTKMISFPTEPIPSRFTYSTVNTVKLRHQPIRAAYSQLSDNPYPLGIGPGIWVIEVYGVPQRPGKVCLSKKAPNTYGLLTLKRAWVIVFRGVWVMGTKSLHTNSGYRKRSDILFQDWDKTRYRYDILSGGKRGLSAPYGDHWRRWRNFNTWELTRGPRCIIARATKHSKRLLFYATCLPMVGTAMTKFFGGEDREGSYIASTMGRIEAHTQVSTSDANRRRRIVPASQESTSWETWPSLMWLPKPLQWFRPALTILLTMLEEIRANNTETYLDFFNGVKRRLEAGIAKEFAVVTYPDITTRIQEELDNVVGRDRLPTFDDEGSLPYLVASSKRWRPVLPLAIPHATNMGDVYAGYDIPAGTTVYGNIDALVKDPPYSRTQRRSTLRGFSNRIAQQECSRSWVLTAGRGAAKFCGRSTYVLPLMGVASTPTKTVDLGLTRMPAPFHISVSVRHAGALRLIENENRDAELRLREWEF